MSEFLHKLVNSLSTSEKVYFKRTTKVHAGKRDKNYLKIYEAVEKTDHYEKDTLSTLFEGTTIQKYLSSEIDYLKEKLLISLFNFNLNRSKRNKIQKGILIIEVLAAKGFRKEALKKLKSIKKNALLQEEFTWILRLIELEEIILFKEGIIGYKDQLKVLRTQRNEVTGMIQNLNDYHILRQEIRELQFSKELINNATDIFESFNSNPLIEKIDACKSIKAKEHWYYIRVLLNYLKRDFETGLVVSAQYVEFMQKNDHLFDLNKILPGLSNYIFHAALTKDKKHFDLGLQKLKLISDKKGIPHYYLRYIQNTRNLEFAYYSKNKALSHEYLTCTSELLDQQADQLEESQVQYSYMLIVRAAIILEKPKIGMHYVNQWQQRGVLPYRKVQARLFSIMIHFELSYFKLIQSEIILLKKLTKENPREKILIKAFYSFLNSFFKYPNRKETLISKFQAELKAISINNERYYDFISFDYHWWSLRLNQLLSE